MTRIIDFAAPLGQKAGPGQWNDLDMRKPLLITSHGERSHVGIHSSGWVRSVYTFPLGSISPTDHSNRNGGMTFDEYGKPCIPLVRIRTRSHTGI